MRQGAGTAAGTVLPLYLPLSTQWQCDVPSAGKLRRPSATLGILAPEGEGFGLDTRLPVKRIGEGAMEFTIVPKCDLPEGQFVPVYPEEPFAYLNRLKDCYLACREGQVGVVIR